MQYLFNLSFSPTLISLFDFYHISNIYFYVFTSTEDRYQMGADLGFSNGGGGGQ